MNVETIDGILGQVAREEFRGASADALLDLREAARNRHNAGDCLGCYFKLLNACSSSRNATLSPLRRWLESQLEIVARAPESGELERLPLSLGLEQADSLETFCITVIHRFREDRNYAHLSIELSLDFREHQHIA